jgi:hypothetical protein
VSLSPQEVLVAFQAAPGFREAARLILEQVLEGVRKHLGDGETAVSASLHLRPDDDYVGVAASGDDALVHAGFSATAWQHVRDLKQPIGVQVATGWLWPLDQPDAGHDVRGRGRFRRSQLAYQQRAVTHVFVLPMRPREGGVEGMVSIELRLKGSSPVTLWQRCRLDVARWPRMFGRDLLTKKPDAIPLSTEETLPVWAGATMRPILARLQALSRMGRPLLLSGPPGAGTSHLAHQVARWYRPDGPIVVLPVASHDLASLVEHLSLETKDSPAWRARNGTLILDGVDALEPTDPRPLLAALDALLDPVFPDAPRLVSTARATRASPLSARLDRSLRDRLGVLGLAIPGLDQRRDEIPHWAGGFLAEAHRDLYPHGDAVLSPEAEALARQLPLAGSLPELRALMNAAYIRALGRSTGPTPPSRMMLTHADLLSAVLEDGASRRTGTDLRDEVLRAAHHMAAWVAERWRLDRTVTDVGGLRGPFVALLFEATSALLGRDDALRALGAEAKVGSSNLARDLRSLLEAKDPFLACMNEG